MDAIFKCVCHLPTNHREIGCFFKYVIFLLKRFVSYMEMFQSRGNDAQTELLKNQMWMQISAEYDEYFTDFDASCEDGCALKLLQKSAENQLFLLASGRCDKVKNKLANINTIQNHEVNIDMNHISLLLESIVANPPLFDRTNQHFNDNQFKFHVWNKICTEWYKKDQSYCGDSNFHYRFAERMLHRISNPLSVNYETALNDSNDLSSGFDLTGNSFRENMPQLVIDASKEINYPANLLIKNIEKLYIVSNATKDDESTAKDEPTKVTKKKSRRARRYRKSDTDDQINQHLQESTAEINAKI